MQRPKTDSRPRFDLRPLRIALVLCAVSIPMFFLGLGDCGLSEPDEPYYAVPALEMLRSGEWTTTTLGGEPWFDKPILFYWVVAASYRVFGVSEWSARLGSALAGLGGVLAVFLLGRLGRLGERGAFLSAVVLATMIEYALISRAAITDPTLVFFLTLGMLLVERFLATTRPIFCGLAGAAFGLATLTKGPVGLLVPGASLVLYAIAARRRDLFRPQAVGAAALGVAATAGPWFGFMLVSHRDLVLQNFLGEGNLGRFLEPEHAAFPLFYLLVLAAGMLPWTGALPSALARALSRESRRAERAAGQAPGPLYFACWFAMVLGVFSLSASKLLSYVLPAFPPAAMLVGGYWIEALAESRRSAVPRHARVSTTVGLIVSISIAGAIVFAARQGRWSEAQQAAVAIGAVLASGAALAGPALRRGATATFACLHAGTGAVAVLLFVFLALPAVELHDSERPFVRELERLGLSRKVEGALYEVQRYGPDFYLGRTLPRLRDLSQAARRGDLDPDAVWIVPLGRVDEISAGSARRVEVVASCPHLAALRIGPQASPSGGPP